MALDTADIVVTASKRSERLVDVPIAITALSSDTLQQRGAQRFEDYQAFAPGLSTYALAPGYNQIVLRGITTGANQLSTTVGTYFDEAPTNSSNAYAAGSVLTPDPDLLDVERVEVLRGPQGTLYGANALGGVLRYVFVAPDVSGVSARAQLGGSTTRRGDEGWAARGAVNVPIVTDRAALRVSGFHTDDAGFIDNVANGRRDVNRSLSDGGRAALRVDASDSISLDISSLYQDRRTRGFASEDIDPTTLRPSLGRYQQSRFSAEGIRTKYQLHQGVVNVDLGPVELTSATSFGRQKSQLDQDQSGVIGAAVGALLGFPVFADSRSANDLRKLTQEVRLASEANSQFEWLIGGYYTREKARFQTDISGFAGPNIPLPAPFSLLVSSTVATRYREHAVFANATLHVTERLSLQGGGRWSRNEQRFAQDFAGLLYGPLAGTVFRNASDEDAWTYTVSPKFEITPDINVYARVAKGFRPGGPNLVPPGAGAVVGSTYSSDTLTQFEGGLKALLLEQRLGLDVAVYTIDWSDIQQTANIGGFNYLLNGGGARSSGVEASANYAHAGLRLSGNVAFNDTELKDAVPAAGGAEGDRLPYSPRWSGAASADYDLRISEGLTASLGGSVRHTGARQAYYSLPTATNPGNLRLPAFTLLDLRAGLRSGPFSLSLYVQNLLDERALLAANTTNRNPFTGAGAFATLARPRTVGVTLDAAF